MDVIDLRSDSVARPTPAMREAIAGAEVGEAELGEDPTVNRLQERVAELLGKEAAIWLPTGTMANQVALRLLTRPGDDVVVSRESHAMWHVDRLADDHANASRIAAGLAESRFVDLDPADVQTNIVVFRFTSDGADAPSVVDRARALGVLVFPFGPRTIRAVTHLDVSQADCERAASMLVEAIEARAA